MIIVSQDKRIITNFDNTIGLQINEHILNSDGERDFEIRAITEKRDCVIAFYETEERAKEVLDWIVTCYTGDGKVQNDGFVCMEIPKE